MIGDSCTAVRSSGTFYCVKIAYMYLFSINLNLRNIFIASPTHPLNSKAVVRSYPSISTVLAARCLPKICDLVVSRISIYVVYISCWIASSTIQPRKPVSQVALAIDLNVAIPALINPSSDIANFNSWAKLLNPRKSPRKRAIV